ncbi:hypothetical protein KAW80_01340 [Candidatus Babeliales bacterium]|nr:hypothetical protein [Candidatus Babeliales bacterium]
MKNTFKVLGTMSLFTLFVPFIRPQIQRVSVEVNQATYQASWQCGAIALFNATQDAGLDRLESIRIINSESNGVFESSGSMIRVARNLRLRNLHVITLGNNKIKIAEDQGTIENILGEFKLLKDMQTIYFVCVYDHKVAPNIGPHGFLVKIQKQRNLRDAIITVYKDQYVVADRDGDSSKIIDELFRLHNSIGIEAEPAVAFKRDDELDLEQVLRASLDEAGCANEASVRELEAIRIAQEVSLQEQRLVVQDEDAALAAAIAASEESALSAPKDPDEDQIEVAIRASLSEGAERIPTFEEIAERLERLKEKANQASRAQEDVAGPVGVANEAVRENQRIVGLEYARAQELAASAASRATARRKGKRRG